MGKVLRRALGALAVGLVAGGPLLAVERLTLSHVRQVDGEPPRVRVYIDVLAPDGSAVTGLEPASLTATLGRDQATVESLTPFESSGEGVAYVFLVDVSRSLTQDQFASIREALGTWIDSFGPADRGAILAFGSESRLVVDFTADAARLAEGLASLGPTDNQTLLHRGLLDAIEVARRRDPDLPGRRTLVVLTDGLDEGSGLTLDDVFARLAEAPVPVHAIGYSRLRPPEKRQQYLDALQRLATRSGGSFFEAGQGELAESYSVVRGAIRRVWVAEISCAGCNADGREYRLQIDLDLGGRVLSEGADVRLLPLAGTRPLPGASGQPAGQEAEGQLDAVDAPWWSAVPWWVFLVTALLASLLAWLIFGARKRPLDRATGEIDLASAASPVAVEAAPAAPVPPGGRRAPTAAPGPSMAPIPLPAELAFQRPRHLRLVVVRGSRKGKEYRATLKDRVVVGSRSSCDCVLADEPGVAPQQFELYQEGDQVFVRDLAKDRPTRFGGHALTEPRPIKSNDLLGTQEIILRLIIEG